MSKRRLGKGIDALLQGRDLEPLETELHSVESVPIAHLHPNPNQPRKRFDPETLEELAQSIAEKGIIQPILAEKQSDESYTIIAGERRFRAAQMAGLTVVPVLPGTFSEEEKLEIALIENVQREDLNAIEEARAYRELMDRAGLSQDELAHHLGKSRPAIANSLRLLRLPQVVQDEVTSGTISAGHARSLLTVRDGEKLEALGRLVIEQDLNVRQTERVATLVEAGTDPKEAVNRVLTREAPQGWQPAAGDSTDLTIPKSGEVGSSAGSGKPSKSKDGGETQSVEMKQYQQMLLERIGNRVQVLGTNDKGRIVIDYYNDKDLERVVELILGQG